MQAKYPYSILTRLFCIILLLSPPIFSPTPGKSSTISVLAETQSPFILHGEVKDQLGNPMQAAIYATNQQGTILADLQTDANGTYTVTIPIRESLAVMATPLGLPQNIIVMPDGYQISGYFEITKGILPANDTVEVNFVIPPAAALRLEAYSPAGDIMNFDAVYEAVNPPGYFGYGGVYGVFPMAHMDLPVPAEASIGMLRWAWPPDNERSLWEACFGVPPGEPVFILMLWEVPGIGNFPLRADNQGLGYTLTEWEDRKINLVYDFAETEYRRALELKTRLEGEGHSFSNGLLDLLSQAFTALKQARSQSDEQVRALSSYEVLRLAIKAKEQMTVEAAEADIPERRNDLKIVVQDLTSAPISGAAVTIHQNNLDFVMTAGMGSSFNPFPYPSYQAGIDIGFQSLYGVVRWNEVSPQEGVFDFSAADAAFRQWQDMGYEVTACLAWLGSDNVPDWATNLDFTEFQKQMGLFVRKAVEHFDGTIKYLNIVTEINLQTTAGSRYVSVAYPSNYLVSMQSADLIELIRTAFRAGREAGSEMLLGYYGISDYNFSSLNPLPFGARPTSYTFLKSVLERGVQPDYIGIELYPATLGVPQDLSSVAEILQAYHALTGLPVLVAESLAYSSRAEDYGETGPTPHVYWHEGFTQAAQSEWETSFYKIALSQPYILGLQMFQNGGPDHPLLAYGLPSSDCTEDPSCVSHGIDSITQDFEPKQVHYAMQDLIASWKTNGSGETDPSGEVSFNGLGGTYTIGVTTPEGLYQSFERKLNQTTSLITLTLDSQQAILDLQQHLARAQKEIDWSAQLNRLLDYNQLHSWLAAAMSSMSSGDYADARSLADQILEVTAITIDGNAVDWQGIAPILTAAQGGVLVTAPGTDLKALYGMRDDTHLYLLIEVYDPPISLQPSGNIGGIYYPLFSFNLQTSPEGQHHLSVYLPYTGQMDVYRLAEPPVFITTQYTVAHKNVLELKVPLALLDNPTQLAVCGYVAAADDGEVRISKQFDSCAEVLHSTPAIYLPLVVGG